MKKIGILTFHCAHNYGAVLQAFALQEFLKQNGYEDVYFINYRPSFLLPKAKVFDLGSGFAKRSFLGKVRLLLVLPLTYRKRLKRMSSFNKFIDEKLAIKEISLNPQENIYDTIIIGSDQVWNIGLTKGENMFYGGQAKEIIAKRKIAYAASIGTLKPTENDDLILNNYISNLDAVSVREISTKKHLEKISKRAITNVLDPVFFLDKNILNLLDTNIKRPKYVLVYQIHIEKNVLRIAKEIAKELGCEVIQLRPSVTISSRKDVLDCATIPEFISLFKNAEFVVTTSFHGTAFSIINRKPFYTVKLGSSVDTRSLDLLDILGLGSRAIDMNVTPKVEGLNYTNADMKLEELQKISSCFLLDNI